MAAQSLSLMLKEMSCCLPAGTPHGEGQSMEQKKAHTKRHTVPRGDFAPTGEILQCLEIFLVVTTEGVRRAEVKDADKHSTMHAQTASHRKINDLTQNSVSARKRSNHKLHLLEWQGYREQEGKKWDKRWKSEKQKRGQDEETLIHLKKKI